VTQAVADTHTEGQMDGQTLCDNKGRVASQKHKITASQNQLNQAVHKKK